MAVVRVASAKEPVSATPHWLAGYRLAPELGAYLGKVLHGNWPRLRWDLTDDANALQRWQVDAWLVTGLPRAAATTRPLIWIRSPAHSPHWYQLSPGRWCMPAPVLAAPLYACVRDIVITTGTA